MGKKKGCQDCPDTGRDMSRGEFLKTGAVAAGGVAVGGSEASSARISSSAAPCPPPPCPGPSKPAETPQPGQRGFKKGTSDWRKNGAETGELVWAIPAGILNILWGEVFPRLVARKWANVGGKPGADVGMTHAEISARATGLKDRNGEGVSTPHYNKRVDLLISYLDSANPLRMPIRVLGQSGYDFILSGDGLDLLVPAEPKKEELCHYYSYRRTGRAAIGVPSYLTGAVSALTVDSPTGPSQAWLSRPIVEGLVADLLGSNYQACDSWAALSGNLERRERDGAGVMASEVLRVLERHRPLFVSRASEEQLGTIVESLNEVRSGRRSIEETEREVWSTLLREGAAALDEDEGRTQGAARPARPVVAEAARQKRDAVILRHNANRIGQSLVIFDTVGTARCMLDAFRCWQIEGSVIRGIFTESPRIVATAWVEQVNGCEDLEDWSYTCSYEGVDDEGLRRLFSERLESHLPSYGVMDFEAPVPSLENLFDPVPDWVEKSKNDILITNLGIYFPELPPVPDPGDAFGEIAAGRASNPVFTDTRRCDLDG